MAGKGVMQNAADEPDESPLGISLSFLNFWRCVMSRSSSNFQSFIAARNTNPSESRFDWRSDITNLWSGNTLENQPISNGWKCRPIKRNLHPELPIYLLGQSGKQGCACFRRKDGAWGVAVYLETPEEVYACITKSDSGDVDIPRFTTCSDIPGFGNWIVSEVEYERRSLGLKRGGW